MISSPFPPSCVPPRASRRRSGSGAPTAPSDGPAPAWPGQPARRRPAVAHLAAVLSGMVLALLWLCWWGPALAHWWQQQQAQYAYGTARVSQLDLTYQGRVHHLLAQDWHGTILIVEVTAPASLPSGHGTSASEPVMVHLCTFPAVVQEPSDLPRVVTLQAQSPAQPGQPPLILVHVEGVPFVLTCQLTKAASPFRGVASR